MKARPSLCLWAVSAVVALVALIAAPAAQATPTPALAGTDPESPGLSLTPVVHGSSDGIISFSLPGLRTAAVTSAGGGAGNTIYLYPNQNCEGAPFGTASAEEFDNSGIQVEVEPETTTWISANQEDGFEELSGCSTKPISYEQVNELPAPPVEEPPAGGGGGTGSPPAGGGNGGTTVPPASPPAPPAAPHLRVLPSGLANNTIPAVAGSAPGAEAVKLYGVANCSGSPLARVSPGQLAAGVPVRVLPNAITAFSAVSIGAGGASGCSAPAYYTEDSTRPHTRITMGPSSKTRRRVAVFRFTDTTGAVPGTRFLCKVNKRKWRKCRSPIKIRHLRPRKYVFKVRAVDTAGNRDKKPAKRRFRVVRH